MKNLKENFLINEKGAKVQSLYGVPVMLFENAFTMKSAEVEFLKNLEFEGEDEYNVVKTSKNKHILNEKAELLVVKDQINHYACKFIDEIISVDNEFEMVQSWVSKTKPGEDHHQHFHPGAIFSLVYYAECEKSEFYFNPKQNFLTKGFNFDYNIKEQNIFNSLEVTYTPKTGDILIFPGWVIHSAKNLGTKNKYIIGANYFIRGDVGDYEKITIVKDI